VIYHSENCGVSDEGVELLLKMQLTELRLGIAMEKPSGDYNTSDKVGFTGAFNALKKMLRIGNVSEKADSDSNTFTKEGFTAMLKKYKRIWSPIVIDMQLPHVKELSIS
jgi:hypothetical protein